MKRNDWTPYEYDYNYNIGNDHVEFIRTGHISILLIKYILRFSSTSRLQSSDWFAAISFRNLIPLKLSSSTFIVIYFIGLSLAICSITSPSISLYVNHSGAISFCFYWYQYFVECIVFPLFYSLPTFKYVKHSLCLHWILNVSRQYQISKGFFKFIFSSISITVQNSSPY